LKNFFLSISTVLFLPLLVNAHENHINLDHKFYKNNISIENEKEGKNYKTGINYIKDIKLIKRGLNFFVKEKKK